MNDLLDPLPPEPRRAAGWVNADGSIGLTRCPECRTENYAMAVPSGICYACGYRATPADFAK